VNGLSGTNSNPVSSTKAAGAGKPGILFALAAWLFASSSARAQEDIHAVANMFDPKSVPALQIHDVSLLVLLICAVIFIIVAGLITYTVLRFRHKGSEDDHEEPPQIYGSSQIELAWTVLPIIITVVLILVTARTIAEIQNAKMPESALQIRVVGHQWWWEVHYPGQGFVTANEIHIPLSTEEQPEITHVALESADVIHSFWVPQLNGKTDLIPNRTNHLWLQPWETGTFLGNCAEYCGAQHGHMLLRVIVHTPEDFKKWVASQQAKPVTPPTDPKIALGYDTFVAHACINCHTIDGTVANGVFGPDLTHLMTRDTIGAGAALNTPKNLWLWVRDPQASDMKPGCLMPDMKLLDSEVDQIVAYLETLK